VEVIDVEDDPGSALAHGDGRTIVSVKVIEPGGESPSEASATGELWFVVAGNGWVREADGPRLEVDAGQAVYFERGSVHSRGSASGLTALVVEVTDLYRDRPS
jgi:quercetin dioxygenase-like cupin family protein